MPPASRLVVICAFAAAVACRGIIGIEPLTERDGPVAPDPDASTTDGADGDATTSADGAPACPRELGSDPFSTDLRGCVLLASDTAAVADPLPIWSMITCETPDRHRHQTTGGDTHPDIFGVAQGNDSFRRLTVIDGDSVFGAERCDLGKNDLATGATVFYREGEHVLTTFSVRMPQASYVQNGFYQAVMQIQRTYPASGGGGAIQMELRSGSWILVHDFVDLWTTPARADVWTRFAVDAYYTQSSAGRLRVFVDLDGDGDASDANEQSPVFTGPTLQTQDSNTAAGSPPQGAPIPSHLRLGLNHNPSMSCPSPAGCHVDIDNVQVVRLAP